MTRQEKIKILQGISKGKISIKSLRPWRVYMFEEDRNRPGIFIMDGKEYTQTQYEAFCKKAEASSDDGLIWEERHTSHIEHLKAT